MFKVVLTKEEKRDWRNRDKIRFWKRVSKGEGCWEWLAARNSKGYGEVTYRGHQTLAHRVSWIITHGEIAATMEVCHSCDNPACVRPDHLFLGTHADNMRDMVRKNRHSKFGRRKLTPEQVYQIRERLALGEQQKQLASDFGVTKTAISLIARGVSWSGLK